VKDERTSLDALETGEGMVRTWDAVHLFYRWMRPASQRGIVVLVHGITEHSGRYSWLAEALVKSQFAFYAFDLRGHGRSEGARGHVDRFEHYVEDVHAFCDWVRHRETDTPLFLMGHSMGSLIVARYTARGEPCVTGAILASTPAHLCSPPSLLLRMAGQLLAVFTPRLSLQAPLDPCALSHDPEVIHATRLDPLMQRRVTLRWATELFAAIRDLPAYARALQVPVLVLHGTEDSIAGITGAYQLLRWIGSTDKALKTFPGARHELYNEVQRDQVFVELIGWLEQHTAIAHLGKSTSISPERTPHSPPDSPPD
jgi:alpha-beta hydrolase superfamily lysophospholipase